MSANSFNLRLIDGTCWTFTATKERSAWLARFANTLELNETVPIAGAACRTIHIVSPGEAADVMSHAFPDSIQLRSFDLLPLRIHSHQDSLDLIYEVPDNSDQRQMIMSMWYAQYPLYPSLLKEDNLPVHGGMSVHEKRGVLFAAPGGTGKSTTLRRLPDTWHSINDDETWLVLSDGDVFAHSLPTWSDLLLRGEDRCWDTTQANSLSAVVFLRQSTTVHLQPLDHAVTTNYLKQAAEQILRRAWIPLPPPDMTAVRKRVFELADVYAAKLQGYLLDLNLTDPFWIELERHVIRL